MTYGVRILVLSLAVFGAANLLASVVLAAIWPRLAARRSAPALFSLRVFPAAIGAAVTGAAGTALLVFEPSGDEPMGSLLVVLAVVGSAGALRMLVRCTRELVRAQHLTSRWLDEGTPIELPGATLPAFAVTSAFPIVAVVGIRKPRLIVGRSVLAACPPNEMAAIVAHEQHHVTAHHNLCRLILSALPDASAWLPFGDRASDQWHVAAEREADDAAAQSAPEGHLDLASALIRVARLAPARQDPVAVPVSALFRGESIDQRVERLLERRVAPIDTWPTRGALMAAAVAIGAGVVFLHPLYDVLETAVERLP